MSTSRPDKHVLLFVVLPACHARPEIYAKKGLLAMWIIGNVEAIAEETSGS